MPISPDLELRLRISLEALLEPHAVSREAVEDCRSILKRWAGNRAEHLAVDAAHLAEMLRDPRDPEGFLETAEIVRDWFARQELSATNLVDQDLPRVSEEDFRAEDCKRITQWLSEKKRVLKTALDELPRCAVIESDVINPQVKTEIGKDATQLVQDLLWFRKGQFDELWIAHVYGDGPSDKRYRRFRGHIVGRLNVPFEMADDFINDLYQQLHPRGGERWARFRPEAASFLTFVKLEAKHLAKRVHLNKTGQDIDELELFAPDEHIPERRLMDEESAQMQPARLKRALQQLFTLDSAPHQIVAFAFHKLFGLSDSEVADSVWYGKMRVLVKILSSSLVEIAGVGLELALWLDSSDPRNLAFRINQPVRRTLKRVQLFPTRRPTNNYAEFFGAVIREKSSEQEQKVHRGLPENRKRFLAFLRAETAKLRLCDFQLEDRPRSNVRKFSNAVLKRMQNQRANIYRTAGRLP